MGCHGWSLIGAALAALALAPAASAASFSVDDLGDTDHGYGAGACPSPCSLRDAIDAVNSGPGTGDTVTFAGTGTVTLTGALPAVTSGVTIDGGVIGDVTLDAAGFFGLSFIAGTSTVRDLVLVRSAAGGVNVSGTARVSVLDNIIGTDILGAPGLGNAYGVHLDAPDAVVGGNVISGNTNAGVELGDAARAVIAGNRIGLKPAGLVALGNGTGGVTTSNPLAVDVTVGGPAPADRNVISGNGYVGVAINANTSTRWTIQGNWIGTDVAGTAPVPNVSGGIFVADADDNLITGNVVSGNGGEGISLTQGGGSPARNTISGNVVGSDASGQLDLGNNFSGIALGAALDTVVGPDNLVAHNGQAGVAISRANFTESDRVRVTANRLRDNFGAGIDLDLFSPFVPNDALDADSGPNGFQNTPIVDQAVAGGGATTVSGTLGSEPSRAYRVELFSSPVCDASGSGEGASYLGFLTTGTDAAGNAAFSGDVPGDASGLITATATDPQGRTSEFSPCVGVTQRPGGGGGGTPPGGGGGTPPGGPGAPTEPPPTGGQDGLAPPAPGTVVAGPVSGTVLVRERGSNRFVSLGENEPIRAGAVVDVSQGRVSLRTRTGAGGGGEGGYGEFFGGRFLLAKAGTTTAPPDLRLQGSDPCKAGASAKRRRKKKRLWGDASGSFRVTGRYGNAINSGTRWLTEDLCRATRFRVAKGTIHVQRNGQRRRVTVRAPRAYVVRPRR